MKGKLLQTLLEKGGEHAAKGIMAFGGLEIVSGILRKLDWITRQDAKMLGGLAFVLTGYMIERGRQKSEANAAGIAANRERIVATEEKVEDVIPTAAAVARETARDTVRASLPEGVMIFREDRK
jgi:hypothetical protein